MLETRQFRGISRRLAVHYLEGLGGTAVDADGTPVEGGGESTEAAARVDRVLGDDWTAELSTAEVDIGPSITLTEVRIAFEGGESTLPDLVDAFATKAMRAGG